MTLVGLPQGMGWPPVNTFTVPLSPAARLAACELAGLTIVICELVVRLLPSGAKLRIALSAGSQSKSGVATVAKAGSTLVETTVEEMTTRTLPLASPAEA